MTGSSNRAVVRAADRTSGSESGNEPTRWRAMSRPGWPPLWMRNDLWARGSWAIYTRVSESRRTGLGEVLPLVAGG